jgi:hypothetical protein
MRRRSRIWRDTSNVRLINLSLRTFVNIRRIYSATASVAEHGQPANGRIAILFYYGLEEALEHR